MRGLRLAGFVVATIAPVVALADIGQPQSFSVTVTRGPGTVNAELSLMTVNGANRAASDALTLGVVLLVGGQFPPTFNGSQSAVVQRGAPTVNRTFSASFSIAVPDEHRPLKYLAFAKPTSAPTTFSGSQPPGVYDLLSFQYSAISQVDVVLEPVPTPTPGGPPVWYRAKGAFQLGPPIPLFSQWGLIGLGALLAVAGALLMRRS